ncbi:MAG: Flp pilus assembly protein CpaB [Bdellovibrionia bacterium]
MGSTESRNLMISIFAGIFATFLMYSYSQEKKAEYDKKFGKTRRVVIAKEDIQEMQTIYDTMLEVSEMPEQFVHKDAIILPEEIVGNVAAVPIKKGQVIATNHLLTPGPDTGIALQVAPTMRAITIPVDEVRGVAKLIRPGDRVDIFAAVDSGRGVNSRREVVVLQQDVPVLATGISVVNNIPRTFEVDASGKRVTQMNLTGDTKYNTITVEVGLKEAQDLFYILSTAPGNLFLALRNPNDRGKPPRLPASTSESIAGRALPPDVSPVGMMPPAPAPVMAPRPVAPAPTQQRRTAPAPNGFRTL